MPLAHPVTACRPDDQEAAPCERRPAAQVAAGVRLAAARGQPAARGCRDPGRAPPAEAATALRLLRLVLAFTRGAAGAPVLRPDALEGWEAEFRSTPRHPLWPPAVTIRAEPGAGERADLPRIANACMAACEWLLARGAWQSALLYAQAAALAWPHNPRLAWAAGRMLRNYGQMREAETWLRRAARIAVWNGDVETQDLALNSLGNLFAQQGCYRQAELYLQRALRIAGKSSPCRSRANNQLARRLRPIARGYERWNRRVMNVTTAPDRAGSIRFQSPSDYLHDLPGVAAVGVQPRPSARGVVQTGLRWGTSVISCSRRAARLRAHRESSDWTAWEPPLWKEKE